MSSRLHSLEVDMPDSNNPTFYLDGQEKESKKSRGGRRSSYIVLVCGGRDFKDAKLLCAVIDHIDIAVLIHGNCLASADTMASWYFSTNFTMLGIPAPVRPYPVERDESCREQGYPRNRQMLEEDPPDFVLAFPGGEGTANMIAAALERNIPVLNVSRTRNHQGENIE